MNLRPYQKSAIDMIRQKVAEKKDKILLFLATGGGKSIIFKNIINSLVKNDKKIIFVVRRRELVFQAAIKHFNNLDYSVIMGNEKGFDANCKFQISSIDTLQKRIDQYDFLHSFDYVIIDEAHDTTSDKYRDTLNKIKGAVFIGLTATPFQVGNRVHDFWECCVKPVEMHELKDQGYLTPVRVFAPKPVDTSGIKKIGGDFNQKQLFDAVSEAKIVGDVVNIYKKYGKNKPAIMFAVNIQHSKMLAKAFNKNGIRAVHIDQKNNKEERKKAIDDLEAGSIKVISNVNIFSTGTDIPKVEVGIMARPTSSLVLYIQQVGRFLRPYKVCVCGNEYGGEKSCNLCGSSQLKYEKNHAIILDHGGNCLRLGMPYKVRDPAIFLTDKKERKAPEISIYTCPDCAGIFDKKPSTCPYCGCESEVSQKEIVHEDGDLDEICEKVVIEKKFVKLKWRENKYRKKASEKFYLLHREFGDIVFNVIQYPYHIKMDIVKNGLLSSASRVIEDHNFRGAKKIWE